MATLTPEINKELSELAESMRAMISKRLDERQLGGHTNDVVQEVYLAAATKFETQFDSTVGALGAWVNGIAKNQVENVGRLHARRLKHETSSTIDTEEGEVTFDIEDPNQDAVDAEFIADWEEHEIAIVINELRACVPNKFAVDRVLALWKTYGNNIAVAAEAMRLTADQLYDSRREVKRIAGVIVKARARRLKCMDEDREPSFGDLFDCLPQEGDEGDWTRAFALATLVAGQQDLLPVRAEDMVGATGRSYNTCRQYLKDVSHMIKVANTILKRGHIQ